MQPTTAFCTIYPMADEEIGRRIAAERENKGISQSELARALGISPQAVQKWEDGGRPRFARLPTIADALGVDLRVLVRGTLYEAALQSADEIPDVNVARDRVRKKRLELIERNPGELIGKLPRSGWKKWKKSFQMTLRTGYKSLSNMGQRLFAFVSKAKATMTPQE
jgi:transcriptional regulator with XRE-family HTH domain